ncbi:replication initiation protein (plasmid) [Moraxella bovis]|uniref:Replication initiation protein n=1 Tax=Moraxella bovis TaxID=476 RepID=A0ABY6MDC8_MORBO|nr:replication initiation protein [Moraxella bovis]UYZ90976.1 replication initiation protein [Moraxella bovis]UZA04875.1 replication initiation protein [Moraxella bovis]UZA18142.1 replication initiation protein [Moraxella bovis]
MTRKFSELTPSEQLRFNSLVSFMSETWNERIEVKLDIVQRFNLDIGDSVVMDFLTGVYVPPAPPPMPVKDDIPPPPKPRPPHENPDRLDPPIPIADFFKEQTMTAQEPSLPVVAPVNQAQKIKKREMTYANSEDLIIIQNRLLHAISHLTLNERRLILFLSPIVRKRIEKEPNNRVFYVLAQEFADEYKLKGKYLYSELAKIADSILDKHFFFWYATSNGRAKKGVNWVSECDYIENEGMIKIRLDNTVIEMLTVFDKATGHFWTQYQKEWIINLGAYGIIMLEMILSSKENKGHYTAEHLREKFNCVDTYPRFSDFKLYVIDKSIKEVHKHTPIRIEYQQHKAGRIVTGLTFSYIDTSIKSVKDKTKNSDDKPKENNPFVNFKMTPKQLAVFGAKIAKKIDKDIEIVIDEISNVYLQAQYVEYLKLLDFVPSDWYTQDEIKDHPTAEQIAQAKKKAKQETKRQEELEQAQLKAQLRQDYETLLANAEEFVLANQKRIGIGIEKMYFEKGDYQGVIRIWERYLLSERDRKGFALLDEILSR